MTAAGSPAEAASAQGARTEAEAPPTPINCKPKALGSSLFKSTWRQADRTKWNWAQKLITGVDIWPLAAEPPQHAKDAPVPVLSGFTFNRWLVPRAAVPFLLHWAWVRFVTCGGVGAEDWQQCSSGLHPILAFLFYSIAFKLIGIHSIKWWRALGGRYGYFDGDKPRDEVTDDKVTDVILSLISTSTFRPIVAAFLIYDRTLAPPNFGDWKAMLFWVGVQLPLQVSAYSITLDFWFYWYHRLMHEVPWLWKFHKAHHRTRHPNTLLTLFADETQEVFDLVVIPFFTYYTLSFIPFFHVNFYDWFAIQMNIMKIELTGHSGVRLYFTPPNAAPLGLLQKLGLELIIEDHDLHHRSSWKDRGGNYGKQTRIWDSLFGTTLKREECTTENVKHDVLAEAPW
ncbi:hypothetical protein K437DRAFT_253360 [Tilletiaria anomala UBC 951]|uniref:Fatty acid hydroxylase domain-containing protein n=1 Tax=Tilletiaria anomala (strain ATCC 24038 / CBS 436.72 / UBC 951) TaxID=1037660 RepID=A0A066WRP4_TILAU|nr:uncharacterized protein K437DRAFT_253360 [Tilletiaria anomala UBC 951]KDN53325.1 hypothetical protein K437DRAFT_253360 [Tilletiaria anomala UBC 951]